jgi:hypothetical protein
VEIKHEESDRDREDTVAEGFNSLAALGVEV